MGASPERWIASWQRWTLRSGYFFWSLWKAKGAPNCASVQAVRHPCSPREPENRDISGLWLSSISISFAAGWPCNRMKRNADRFRSVMISYIFSESATEWKYPNAWKTYNAWMLYASPITFQPELLFFHYQSGPFWNPGLQGHDRGPLQQPIEILCLYYWWSLHAFSRMERELNEGVGPCHAICCNPKVHLSNFVIPVENSAKPFPPHSNLSQGSIAIWGVFIVDNPIVSTAR